MNKNQTKFLVNLSEMMKSLGVEITFNEMNLSSPKKLMKFVFEMEDALANEIVGEAETESNEINKSEAFAGIFDKINDGQILKLAEDKQLIQINGRKYIAFLEEKVVGTDCLRCDLNPSCTLTQKTALYGKCSFHKWGYLKKV